MNPKMIGALVDGAIPLVGGIYFTLLALRVVGKKPGESVKFDQWYDRFGMSFKVLGPALIVFGIIQMLRGLL